MFFEMLPKHFEFLASMCILSALPAYRDHVRIEILHSPDAFAAEIN